jgi:hypothetical protein
MIDRLFRTTLTGSLGPEVQVRHLRANGFEPGSAAIPHWPTAIWEETSTTYINIINGQLSHHSPADGGEDDL